MPTAPKPILELTRMPHLDFREALSTPDEKLFSPVAAIPVAAGVPAEAVKTSFLGAVQLSRSALTNIVFVAIASFGGLLCGFYFFNGGEVLRAAAAWPNEFLYPRPLSTDKIDVGVQPNPADYFTTGSSTSSSASSSSNSAPASNTAPDLNALNSTLATASPLTPGTPPAVAPSFLPITDPVVGQLSQISPESGDVFQNLSQTAAQTTATATTTTKSAMSKVISTRRQATTGRAKNSTQTNVARSSIAKTATQTMQQTSVHTQMGMNSFQSPNQSMIGSGVGGIGGMGSAGGLGRGLGGGGGVGDEGGGVGGIGALPGHH